MTEQETHFKRAEDITYEAIAIALEKAKTTIQEKDEEIEGLKLQLLEVLDYLNSLDLTLKLKEENGMNVFKENNK